MEWFEINIEQQISNMSELIRNQQLSVVDGGILEEFESLCSSLFGSNYGVATCNGTSALHLAFFSIGIAEGDEVIVPTYGYHAMVTPICQLGGIPVFCDILEDTLTIDPDEVEKHISKKTKAILVHQPWGNLSNIDRLLEIKKKYNLWLISDSSHAHGALWRNSPVGYYYDIVCASFGKNKLISGGELGIATMNSMEIRDRMLLFGHVNRVPYALKGNIYKHLNNAIGIKYRPHPFAMGIAIEQMKTFPERIRKLINNISYFKKELVDLNSIKFLDSYGLAQRVYWSVVVKVDTRAKRKLVMKYLGENQVPVENNHYNPLLHKNNIFTEYYGIKSLGHFSVAEKLEDLTFQLSAYMFYSDEENSRLIRIFRQIDLML